MDMGDLCLICVKAIPLDDDDSSEKRDTRVCWTCYRRIRESRARNRLKELFEVWDQEPLIHLAGMIVADNDELLFREHEEEQRMIDDINADADASASASEID